MACVRAESGSGEDVAGGVQWHGGAEVAGAGLGADEDEQGGGRDGVERGRGLVCDGDLLQPVGAVEAGDLAVVADADAGFAGDAVDQVLRHGCGQVSAADDDGNRAAVVGQGDGGLAGGVSAADDDGRLPRADVVVDGVGDVEHAVAGEPVDDVDVDVQ